MYRVAVRSSGRHASLVHDIVQASSLPAGALSSSLGRQAGKSSLRIRYHHSAPLISFSLKPSNGTPAVFKRTAGLPKYYPSTALFNSGYVHHALSFSRSYASGGSLPSHTKVALPALSPTMERGSIKGWEKKEGDKLSEGDLLALIETDKATMDFETPEEGYLAKILVPGGTKDVPLGQTVCIIVQNQEDVAAFKDYTPEEAASSKAASEEKSSKSDSPAKEEKKSDSDSQAPPAAAAAADSNFPPHMQVMLPALSPTVDQSTIKSWNKKEGEKLSEGDLIAQVETDKATIDWNWENPEDVYIAKIFVPDGTADVPVGQLVAIFVNNKDDLAAFKNVSKNDFSGSDKKSSAAKAKKAESSEAEAEPAQQKSPKKAERQTEENEQQSSRRQEGGEGGRVAASPLARSLAKSKGIDLSEVKGTGPEGRIIAEDINNFQPGSAQQSKSKASSSQQKSQQKSVKGAEGAEGGEGAFQDIPMTNMRQVIAKRLLQSKQTVPHYYLSVDIVLDEVLQLRKELNSMLEKDKVKISVNDFIIKASALACKKVPQANSSWMDTFIRQFSMVDVSVAVSTEAGLITPIVFNADSKGLVEINADVVRLADAARKGKLKPQEFQGGTFTVSNLGMFDIKNFSAVINPPQSCILAVGGAQKQLVADEQTKEGFRVATVMSVTLSCDHRVVDGAVGAQWLKHFKRCLEHPETMLL